MKNNSDRMRFPLTLRVNNRTYDLNVESWRTLKDVLREDLNLTGTKASCEIGRCGACTVLIDGKAVRSCLILAHQAKNKTIMTIEGMADQGQLHPLQKAFIDHFAFQCGFCSPGMIMTANALLMENKNATEDDIRRTLSGNLCRCTGYRKIVEAVISLI